MLVAREQVWRPLPPEEPQKPKAQLKLGRVHRLVFSSLVFLAFFLGFTVVLCQARIASVGFRLQELRGEISAVRRENQALEGAIQRLQAPDRLEAVAVHRLGMIQPPTGRELRVVRITPPVTGLEESTGGSGRKRPVQGPSKVLAEEKGWIGVLLGLLSQGRDKS